MRIFTVQSIVLFLFSRLALAAQSSTGTSMTANSVFNDYSAGVVAYVLMAGALVVLLLGLGMLVVNLGLMSKRPEDRVGEKRTPGEPAILKNVRGEAYDASEAATILPAEDEDERESLLDSMTPVQHRHYGTPAGDLSNQAPASPEDASITSIGVPLSEQGVTDERRLDEEKVAS